MQSCSIRSATTHFLLSCLFAMTGCSYTILPANLPPPSVNQGVMLSGTTALIVNAEKNRDDAAITPDGKVRSEIRTNRQAWSDKIVEYVAIALAREGCRVQANAGLVVGISLPDILFTEDEQVAQFTVKMLATSSAGWSKTYEGTAKTKKVSSPSEADRLITQAFAEAAKMMLNDPAFQKQLLQKQRAGKT